MEIQHLFFPFKKRFLAFAQHLISFSRIFGFSRPNPGLTLIGVGPGDPSLLTIAALDAIKEATLVAYPISKIDAKSMAAEIAAKWIKNKNQLPLIFPMVEDFELLENAWKDACRKLNRAVKEGENVVFLSQGDCSLYSTSSYVLIYMKALYSECLLKLIPGVNSFSASAAIGLFPLSLQKESLLVTPAPKDKEKLENLLNESKTLRRVLVLLKLGNKWTWIRPVLKELGLLENTLYAKRVGFSDQQVTPANQIADNEDAYFSLLIIRSKKPSNT